MNERSFIDRARASLEHRVEETPPAVLTRLAAARHRALGSRRRRQTSAWFPAMAAAALIVLVAVSGIWGVRTPPPSDSPLAKVSPQAMDFEMLTQGDELTLYDDMAFYLWLDERGLDAG